MPYEAESVLRIGALFCLRCLDPGTGAQPFRFPQPQKNCLMWVLNNSNKYLSVVTNGGDSPVRSVVERPAGLQIEELWRELPVEQSPDSVFQLGPRSFVSVNFMAVLNGPFRRGTPSREEIPHDLGCPKKAPPKVPPGTDGFCITILDRSGR